MKTEQAITKETTIGDVVNKYPEVIPIILNYGLHCVGCGANPYETIENGCLGHGMSKDVVNMLVKDVNEEIRKRKSDKNKIISVTSEAAEKFKQFMKEENKKVFGVRLNIITSDHGTIQYGLEFADVATGTEETFEDNGIKFFVEKDIVENIKGTNIDFIENERGSGFKINNPNSISGGCGPSCGCSE